MNYFNIVVCCVLLDRFNHPVELAKNPDRRSVVVGAKRDFEFAQNELFEVQDAR